MRGPADFVGFYASRFRYHPQILRYLRINHRLLIFLRGDLGGKRQELKRIDSELRRRFLVGAFVIRWNWQGQFRELVLHTSDGAGAGAGAGAFGAAVTEFPFPADCALHVAVFDWAKWFDAVGWLYSFDDSSKGLKCLKSYGGDWTNGII